MSAAVTVQTEADAEQRPVDYIKASVAILRADQTKLDRAIDAIKQGIAAFPDNIRLRMRIIDLLVETYIQGGADITDALEPHVTAIESADLATQDWDIEPKHENRMARDIMNLIKAGYLEIAERILPTLEDMVDDPDTVFARAYSILEPEPHDYMARVGGIMKHDGDAVRAYECIAEGIERFPADIPLRLRALDLLTQVESYGNDVSADMERHARAIETIDVETIGWVPDASEEHKMRCNLLDLYSAGHADLVARILPALEDIVGDPELVFASVYDMQAGRPLRSYKSLVVGSAIASRILARYES
ncbi:MAG: hypothetical protein AB7G06_06385 [Bdellovibrionales bacterium]